MLFTGLSQSVLGEAVPFFMDIENWNRNSGPVLTYPDIFESATFSCRIRLSSTRIRCIRQTNHNVLNPRIRVNGKIRFGSGTKTLRIRKYPDTRRWGLSPADRPLLGPVHTYPDIFESATFSSWIQIEFSIARPHVSADSSAGYTGYVWTIAVSGKKTLRIQK